MSLSDLISIPTSDLVRVDGQGFEFTPGPRILRGKGVPTDTTQPDGTWWLRTDPPNASNSLYVSIDGVWTPRYGPNPSTIFGSSLICWLEGDSGAMPSLWTDKSGNGNNATQSTAAAQPTPRGGTINGISAYSFSGTSTSDADYFNLPDFSTVASSGAELWLIGQLTAQPPASGSGGLWKIDSDGQNEHFVFIDGGAYLGGPSTARNLTWTPSAGVLTSPFCLNVYGFANDNAAYLNDASTAAVTSGTNTVGWSTAPMLGGSNSAGPVASWTNGLIGGFYVVNTKATAQQRKDMGKYLFSKWGVNVANRT